MNIAIVHLFHIIIIGGLFLYIGIQQHNMPLYMYNVILGIGIIILIYHSYKCYINFVKGKKIWVNLFHTTTVAPFLILIGLYKENTPRYYYEFILMFAFAAIGYHSYYMSIGN